MPFQPKVVIKRSPASGNPVLDASQKARLEQDLRTMRQQISQLTDAVEEIQSYLKTT